MRRLFLASLAALTGLALIGAGQAQAPASGAARPSREVVRVEVDHPGRRIFQQQCAPCHGAGPGDDGAPMLPGTMILAAKYKGERPAALELRSDLNAEVLRLFVRNGSGAMPMFRKVELSDADVEAIAAYLRASAQANQEPQR